MFMSGSENISFDEEISILDKILTKLRKSKRLSKNFAIAVLLLGFIMFIVDSYRNGFTVAAIANALVYVIFAIVGFLLLSYIGYNQQYAIDVLEATKKRLEEGDIKRSSKLIKMVEDSFVVKVGAVSEDFEKFLKSFRTKYKLLTGKSK